MAVLFEDMLPCIWVVDERITLRSVDQLEMLRSRFAPDGFGRHLCRRYLFKETKESRN